MFLSALLLACGSAAAFAESYRTVTGSDASGARDQLFEHVQQQLSAMMRAVNARGGSVGPEDAAAAAAYMRICGTHARGLDLDRAGRRALSGPPGTPGRERLITATPPLADVRERLRRNGLTLSDRIVHDVMATDRDARLAALEAIDQDRTTLVCDRLAEAFESAAPAIARRQRTVRRVSTPDEWWCGVHAGPWSTYLAIASTLSAIADGSLADYGNVMWAGLIVYDQLYWSQC
jgi:hypothetical protein